MLHPGTQLYIVAAAQQISADRVSLQNLADQLQLPLLQVAKVVRQQTGLLAHNETTRMKVPDGRYLLQPEDTLAKLAIKFQASEQVIKAVNPDVDWTVPPGLEVPAGETIRLPKVDYRPGDQDSLQSIADLFGVSLARIIAAADHPIQLQTGAMAQLGLRLRVQQDDSLQGISDRYKLPLNEFLLWAKDEAKLLRVGTYLTVAAGGRYFTF